MFPALLEHRTLSAQRGGERLARATRGTSLALRMKEQFWALCAAQSFELPFPHVQLRLGYCGLSHTGSCSCVRLTTHTALTGHSPSQGSMPARRWSESRAAFAECVLPGLTGDAYPGA